MAGTTLHLAGAVSVVGILLVACAGGSSTHDGDSASAPTGVSAVASSANVSDGRSSATTSAVRADPNETFVLVTAPPPDPLFDCLEGRWSIIELVGDVDPLGKRMTGNVSGIEVEFSSGTWSLDAVNGAVSPGIVGTPGDLMLDGTASGESIYSPNGNVMLVRVGATDLRRTVAGVHVPAPEVPFDDVAVAFGLGGNVAISCDSAELTLNSKAGTTRLVREAII